MSTTCSVCSGAVPSGVESASHTALCAEVIRADLDKKRAALEELREIMRAFEAWTMMGPKGREMFVMRGMQSFAAVLHVVEAALK